VIDIAEKDVQMDTEGSRSDGDMPSLQAPALGVHSVECKRCATLQGRARPHPTKQDEVYGHGYAEGYIDGFDTGELTALYYLWKELESWLNHHNLEGDAYDSIDDVIAYIDDITDGVFRHEPKTND